MGGLTMDECGEHAYACMHERGWLTDSLRWMAGLQVPNVMEFADWVGRTKQKPIYVTGGPTRLGGADVNRWRQLGAPWCQLMGRGSL